MDGYKLLIESLRETDSGIYTCIVFNFYGTIHKNFTLDVIGKFSNIYIYHVIIWFLKMDFSEVNKEPVITESHLVNTTTQYNETATFQCKVKSKIRPVIKVSFTDLFFHLGKIININKIYSGWNKLKILIISMDNKHLESIMNHI